MTDGYLENGDLDLEWPHGFERDGYASKCFGHGLFDKAAALVWQDERGRLFLTDKRGADWCGSVLSVHPRPDPASLVSDEALNAAEVAIGRSQARLPMRDALNAAAPHIIAPVVREIREAFEKWFAIGLTQIGHSHLEAFDALLTKYGPRK